MKASSFILLILVSSRTLLGQFTVADYLSAPFQEAEITGLAKQLEYIDNESFKSPLFRELEVRLRSNDFNASPEDFRLRLGFLNPIEQRRNNSYNALHTEYLQTKYSFEANLLIANRYKQLVRHYYLNENIKLLNSEIKQLSIAHNQLQLEKLSIKELISTDESILKKELKRKDIITVLSILEHSIYSVHNMKDSIIWDNFQMISISRITSIILNDTSGNSKEFELALQELRLDEEAFKLKKAESWSNIGFLQAEYDTERGKDINDHLGFQLGISLPVFNVDKPKLQREKLDLLQDEYDLQKIKDETELDRYNLLRRLSEQVWSYELVSDKLIDFEELGNNLTYDNLEDYLALIKYVFYLRVLKNEISLECVNTYIDLLALSGKLTNPPFVVYISEDLSQIVLDNKTDSN